MIPMTNKDRPFMSAVLNMGEEVNRYKNLYC